MSGGQRNNPTALWRLVQRDGSKKVEQCRVLLYGGQVRSPCICFNSQGFKCKMDHQRAWVTNWTMSPAWILFITGKCSLMAEKLTKGLLSGLQLKWPVGEWMIGGTHLLFFNTLILQGLWRFKPDRIRFYYPAAPPDDMAVSYSYQIMVKQLFWHYAWCWHIISLCVVFFLALVAYFNVFEQNPNKYFEKMTLFIRVQEFD